MRARSSSLLPVVAFAALLAACGGSAAPASISAPGASAAAAASATAPARPASAAAKGSIAPSAGALKKLNVQLSFLLNVQYYGVIYAEKTGIFKKNGLQVDFKPGGAGIDPIKMAAAGATDVGLGDPSQVLAGYSQGLKLSTFAADFQKTAMSLMCRGDRGVKELQDISGKTVGLKPGATANFDILLARNNIKKDDLKITPIALTDLASIMAGKIDCQFTAYAVNEPNTLRKNGITPVVFSLSDYGMPSQGDVYVSDPDKLKADPATYAAFVKSVQEAWKTLLKDPAAGAKWIVDGRFVDGLDLDQQTAQATSMVDLIQPKGMTAPLLSLDSEVWKKTAINAKEAGITPSLVDVSQVMNLQIGGQAAKA